MQDETKRETVGKLSGDLIVKQVDDTHSAEEQMREQLSEWDSNLFEKVEEGKRKYQENFYVVVLTKKERIMTNVIRNYFLHRISCPTPEFDQTVYRYNREDDCVEFMWVVPSKDTCIHFMNNPIQLSGYAKSLAHYVLDFADGTLYKLAKKLNGEESDSALLIERKS